MKFPITLAGRRRAVTLAVAGALVASLVLVVAPAAQAAVACGVTYQKSWDNGSSFGANVTITNAGDPVNGWTLAFAFAGNQRVTNGWPVTWTQAAGSNQVTAASNAPWNANLAPGATITIGFNASYTGANAIPAAFSLNGVACNGGGPVNQPPTVTLTNPVANQVVPSTNGMLLTATATDDIGVARVEFRLDGNLIGTDATAPYSVTMTSLPVGNHTAQATAFDNGTPVLSASTQVSFRVSGLPLQPILISPSSLILPSGGSGTFIVRLGAAPTGAVTVSLTRSGNTGITCVPASIVFNNSNWQTGVVVTCTAAAGTGMIVTTMTVSATGYTSTSITITRSGGEPVSNPYLGARVYVNPEWSAKALAEPGGDRVANQPTAVWLDSIAQIQGIPNSSTHGAMGLADHLDQAVIQAAGQPMVVQLVIYNLPGRNCGRLASNGELAANELPRYKAEFIDPIAAILARPAYANLRIVTTIEPDSLPNLVTSTGTRWNATVLCDTMLANGGYVAGVGYTLAKLGALSNVYNYVDVSHHGMIGWDDNASPTANLLVQAAQASGSTLANVRGFITNTANYSALQEPFIPVNDQTRQSRWIDFNRFNEELIFAQTFRTRLIQLGFLSSIGALVDTSRNGWGGPARPVMPGTSPDLNTFVDQSRIDRRINKGNYCNQTGAGLGERPRAAPASGIHAYVWAKPPGESDGASIVILDEAFDRMCDPTYTGPPRGSSTLTGALPGAPAAGAWFPTQFQQLMQNAFPPL